MTENHNWGYHLIVDMAGCNDNICSALAIQNFVTMLLEKIDMVAHGPAIIEYFAEHSKEAEGYSLVQLIETSAITGHFSTNNKDAYIDIFSCKWFDEFVAMDVIFEFFAPTSAHKVFFSREAKEEPMFPFERVLPKEKRSGECNNCGVCCYSDAIVVKEDGIADWLSLHGLDRPVGVEQLVTVLMKKLDQDTLKITMFEECQSVFEEDGKVFCWDYDNRPEKCRKFPERSSQLMNITECSYRFEK